MTKRMTREQVEVALTIIEGGFDFSQSQALTLARTVLSLYDEVERLQEELKSLRDYARRSPR